MKFTVYQNGDIGITDEYTTVYLNGNETEQLLCQLRRFKPDTWERVNENPLITKAIKRRKGLI